MRTNFKLQIPNCKLIRTIAIALFVLVTCHTSLVTASPFFKLNDTTKKIVIFMADSSAPSSGKTGLTVTVRVSKNGAAFGAGGGSVAELEGGFYSYTPASGDMDTLGTLAIRATATGAVDYVGLREIVAFDPFSSSSLGLSNLDAAVSSRSSHTAANVRTEMDSNSTKLANLDAAVSSRSTYAGGDTAGVTTLLSRLTSTRAGLLDNLDDAISTRSSHSAADVWSVTTRALTDKSGFSLSVAPPTVAEIWGEALPGSYGVGTAGKLLSSAGASSDPLNVLVPGSYPDHTVGKIISRLDIPPVEAFVAPVPAAPSSASMCRVYGYLADLNFQPAVNVTLTFRLSAAPAKGSKIITGPVITVKTDSQGRITDAAGSPYIDLQRNDAITPVGSTYIVNCAAAGVTNKSISLAADTFDLATAIP